MSLDVCLVTGMYPTPDAAHGGIFIADRVRALREQGVTVRPIALQVTDSSTLSFLRRLARRPSPTPWTTATTPSGADRVAFEVVTVREGVLDKLRNRRTGHLHQARRLGRAVTRHVAAGHVDVVHAHWAFPAGAAAADLAVSLDRPLVITCHGSDINEVARDPRFTRNVMDTLQRADLVEFVSEALRATAQHLGFSSPRARVVPNGIWAQEPMAQREADHSGRVHRILYVGSLRRIKGADRLPALHDAISDRLGGAFELTVVGTGDLECRLRKWGTARRSVRFTGYLARKEVLREMRRADIMVIPSRSEGWPTAVLEAHSQKLPVVAYDAGGTREAVDDDRLICNADAPIEELADLVVGVLEGTVEVDREALGHRAQNFTWTALADRTIAGYEEISGG